MRTIGRLASPINVSALHTQVMPGTAGPITQQGSMRLRRLGGVDDADFNAARSQPYLEMLMRYHTHRAVDAILRHRLVATVSRRRSREARERDSAANFVARDILPSAARVAGSLS